MAGGGGATGKWVKLDKDGYVTELKLENHNRNNKWTIDLSG